MIHEIEPTSVRDEDVNRQIRHNASRSSVVGVGAETAIDEAKKKDNAYLLRDGEHGGMSLSKPNTSVMGLPGSEVVRPITFEESARLTNIHIKDRVYITSITATVIFVGCRIELERGIDVASGAKAIFLGCLFEGSPPGDVINNPGAITNVQVVGCSNKTAQALGNVTSAAVTT
tara:strand:+ start:2423 stop:2944 length:522 start_codon:yes stop_codon:yes gene_type:complete